ncbi:MAG: acyl carrier protein [Ruminococcaceae bacterium]|nr:acyl carrier protein [Oscillospiraceae bacterium]
MEKLLAILREINPDVNFETEEVLIDGGILDSFDIVTLVAEIDDNFGVQIPAEALTAENFNSARALYDLIRRLEDA